MSSFSLSSSSFSLRRVSTGLFLSAFPVFSQIGPVSEFRLEAPMEHQNLQDSWESGGTFVPSSDLKSLHMNVGVPGRMSYLVSKQPIGSNDFEMEMSFVVAGPALGQRAAHKEGFGIWYYPIFISTN